MLNRIDDIFVETVEHVLVIVPNGHIVNQTVEPNKKIHLRRF